MHGSGHACTFWKPFHCASLGWLTWWLHFSPTFVRSSSSQTWLNHKTMSHVMLACHIPIHLRHLRGVVCSIRHLSIVSPHERHNAGQWSPSAANPLTSYLHVNTSLFKAKSCTHFPILLCKKFMATSTLPTNTLNFFTTTQCHVFPYNNNKI